MLKNRELTQQFSDVAAKIVLQDFLLDATLKTIGQLDISLNNQDNSYVTVSDVTSIPWRQMNPLKPIAYPKGVIRVEEILLVYPVDPTVQQTIKLWPNSERCIFYIDDFVINATLNMTMEMTLLSALDAINKRFLVITEVDLFPLFPATTAPPEIIPIALINRTKISHYHGC